jgi:hypothetical protein
MERHPLDPIALVCGLVTVAGGVIALLHQLGAFHLGPASVVLFGCGLLGAGGAALVVLMARTPVPTTGIGTDVVGPDPDPDPEP